MNTCEYRVIFGDTDQMGVVYYANYLRFFERGRCEYMRQAGMAYASVEKAGYHLPVIDAQVSYKRPALMDDLIKIETRVTDRTRVRISFRYRITRDDDLIAEGATTHACITHDGRPARLPPEVDTLLAAHGEGKQ